MQHKVFALALGLMGASRVAGGFADRINKDYLWQNLDFGEPYIRALPTHLKNVRWWNLGDISELCYSTSKQEGVNPMEMHQYSVDMDDCDQAWLICVQDGVNINDVAREFSKLPVRMRQWVGEITAYRDGGGAWAWLDHITLKGGTTTHPGVMMHEATHCVDMGGGFYDMQSGWSNIGDPRQWLETIDRDSAVPDAYAQSNPTEDLAQFPGLIIIDRFSNGDLQRMQPQLPRIGHQLQKVSDQSDWGSAYGGGILNWADNLRCTRRWPESRQVWPDTGNPVWTKRGAGERGAGSEAARPTASALNSTVYIAPDPSALRAKFQKSNCTFH